MSSQVARVTLPTAIDMSECDLVQQQALSVGQSVNQLILDCANLEFVDSTGVKSLLSIKERLAARGCQVQFENLQESINEIFDLLGVRELLL